MRFRLPTLLKLTAVIAMLLAVIVFYRTYYQKHQIGVSSIVANRMIWQGYQLPEAARDVIFYVDFGGCEAEFAISENDFLQWCNLRKWTPVKISGSTPYFQPLLLPENEKPVTHGYTFSIPDGEGVFDTERLRAAFWVSTFP